MHLQPCQLAGRTALENTETARRGFRWVTSSLVPPWRPPRWLT